MRRPPPLLPPLLLLLVLTSVRSETLYNASQIANWMFKNLKVSAADGKNYRVALNARTVARLYAYLDTDMDLLLTKNEFAQFKQDASSLVTVQLAAIIQPTVIAATAHIIRSKGSGDLSDYHSNGPSPSTAPAPAPANNPAYQQFYFADYFDFGNAYTSHSAGPGAAPPQPAPVPPASAPAPEPAGPTVGADPPAPAPTTIAVPAGPPADPTTAEAADPPSTAVAAETTTQAAPVGTTAKLLPGASPYQYEGTVYWVKDHWDISDLDIKEYGT